MGGQSLTATNSVDQTQLTNNLYQARVNFIQAISKKPGQEKFYNGWLDDALFTFNQAKGYLPKVGTGLASLGLFFCQFI